MTSSKKHNSKETGSISLPRFFESVLKRAKNNTHSGDVRSKDLEKELSRIEKRVTTTLGSINREAAKSDSPDSDAKLSAKLERTTKVLTSEMMQLAAVYHRQVDVARIKRFLGEQQTIIQSSMDAGDDGTDGRTAKSLDGRIVELHSLMAAERVRITKATSKERLKFIISFGIALASLALSIYALWFR